MSRLIDADALIAYCDKNWIPLNVDAVNAQPTIEPQQWIPVTERLPEKRKYVLVRYKNNDMAVACWFDGDENIQFWRAMIDEGWCTDCDIDPTHWMPLPEP